MAMKRTTTREQASILDREGCGSKKIMEIKYISSRCRRKGSHQSATGPVNVTLTGKFYN
jgi:hypothetical protein